jgi:hypothetical protein
LIELKESESAKLIEYQFFSKKVMLKTNASGPSGVRLQINKPDDSLHRGEQSVKQIQWLGDNIYVSLSNL